MENDRNSIKTSESTARYLQRYYEAYREAAAFYQAQLFSETGKPAREYLMTRGISEESIARFELGFAPDDRDSLCRHLLDKGFTLRELLSFGLIRKTADGSEIDAFRNRLMFPIMDTDGNVISFGGRTLDGSNPIYLNTTETIAFSKGQVLYALHLAKNTAERRLIFCEGYLDVIMMHQAGFTNTVGSFGAWITDQQVSLLSLYCDEVLLLFDADAAGQMATKRALQSLTSAGIKTRVPILEGGKDPYEVIRVCGKEKMEQILNSAPECSTDKPTV